MPRTKKIQTEEAVKETSKVSKPAKIKIEAPKEVVEDLKTEVPNEEDFILDEKSDIKSDRYFEANGRRKTSIARVRLFTRGDKVFLVNGKPLNEYFSLVDLQLIASGALEKMKCADKFRILAVVHGGGIHSQAEAIRHGISRALVGFNTDFKKRLKRAGYLTRDSRMRERKKFGLKRARRAPQWAKR